MVDINLPGGASPAERTSWYADDKNLYSTGVNVPTGNLLTNGARTVKVTHLRCWVAGRGANRPVRMGLNGLWSGFIGAVASSQANDTGWIVYGGLHSGGAHTFYLDPGQSGGLYFGRSANGTGSTAIVGGSGGWSGSLSGQMRVVMSPTAPRSVTAVRNSNGTITVSWTAPSSDGGDGIDNYYIGRATNSSFTQNNTQTNVSGSTRSYTFSGLTAGATYYFRVSAGNVVNKEVGYGSAWSNVASAQSSAAPNTPGGPVATKVNVTDTTINLTWAVPGNNGSAITKYDLQMSTAENFSANLYSASPTTNSASVPITLGTKYYFRVRATNSVGNSGWSAVTSYPTVPSAPSSVGVASVNSTTLTASWNAPTNLGGDPIVNYELQWSTSSTFTPGNSSTANNRSRNVTSLTALTPYFFRVRAINGIGPGPWSATSTFTTSDTEPPPPPPAVTRGGRLRVNGKFVEPKVRVRDDEGEWQEPISKIRVNGVWVDPA